MEDHDDVNDTEDSNHQGRENVENHCAVNDTVLGKNCALVEGEPENEYYERVDEKGVNHGHVVEQDLENVRLPVDFLLPLVIVHFHALGVLWVLCLIGPVTFFLLF